MNALHEIFVSFSSRDSEYIREIMAALSGQGLPFWDYSDISESIELGEDIEGRLKEEIDKCSHMIVVISKNSMNREIGRYCRLELMYALEKKTPPYFIPVLIGVTSRKMKSPYDRFEGDFCIEMDFSSESIVAFTMKLCSILKRPYVPPIEAHPNLPFWKEFREEVRTFAHTNHQHTDLIEMLGVFNEYYKKNDPLQSLKLISLFLETCKYRIEDYQPFYPLLVRAVCETEMGHLDEAMKLYCYAEKIKPLNQDAIGGKGTVYFKMKKYEEAKKCFETILNSSINENKDNARINLIITKQVMRISITREEEEFLYGIDINRYPNDLKTSILNSQGVQYKIKQNYEMLEKHCREMIAKNLHDTITICLLRLSLLARGKVAEANRVIQDAIKESKRNPRLDRTALEKNCQ